MSKIILKSICMAIFGICILFSTSAFATDWHVWKNEWIHNGTGQVVNDLEKYFKGKIRIVGAYSTCFPNSSVLFDPIANETTVRWYGAAVNPSTWCGFCVKARGTRKIIVSGLPTWTLKGIIAGPALSQEFVEYGLDKGECYLKVSNTAYNSGPLTIDSIQVAIIPDSLPMQKLFWDSLSTVTWIKTFTNVPLDTTPNNEDFNIDGIGFDAQAGKALIYRAKLHLNSNPSNIVYDVGQYRAEIPIPTPTLTQWGVIILVVLLVSSAVFVMLRRRRATTTA